MDFDVCAQCGKEIEDKGIFYRKKHFCSDECCEEFEEAFLKKEGPEMDDLDDDEDLDFDDDDLEFEDDEDEDEDDDLDDDDFEIDPDDF